MTNPFHPAESAEPRIKALVFGDTDAGKSYLALSSPGKIAVIDTEGGTAFYAGRKSLSAFDVLPTKTYADVKAAVAFLANEKHDYQTLVIDPITIIYETLQTSATILRARQNAKRNYGSSDADEADLEHSDWGRIKRNYKALMSSLVNLDMHVIVTAREKEVTVRDPKTKQFVPTGEYKADAEKGTAYWFDVVVRMVKTPDGRVAIIHKDRTVEDEAVNRTVPSPTFTTLFADALKRKGKGKRKVQDDDEAAAADVAAEEAALHPTAEQVAALAAALKAVGADTERMQREMKIADWSELRPEQVERLTARAVAQAEQAKASTNGTEAKVEATV